ITANADGLTLTLSWTKSLSEDDEDGIDGYYVYFNGELEADLAEGVYQYQFSPDALGDISVSAYRGDEESNEATVNTELVERTGISLDAWTGTNPSAVGWIRSTGLYALYSAISANAGDIDIIWDSRDNTLDSPDQDAYFGTDGHSTAISDAITATDSIAPSDFYNYTEIAVGDIYALRLDTDGTYYIRLETESEAAGVLVVSYGFQKIQGYKRLQ
ncbi:hypothetical protein J7L68_02165, partial [bacterium]|nr:hypothetical protein [bacterium]